MRTRAIVAAISIMFVAACKGDTKSAATAAAQAASNDPHELIAKIDSGALSTMLQRNGTWTGAEGSSSWRAFVDGSGVRRIDESMTLTDGATSVLAHYFTPEGKLILTSERRVVHVQNTDRPPSITTTTQVFGFIGDSATSVSKIVDGVVVAPQKYEIDGARNHSMALLDLARNATPAPKKP